MAVCELISERIERTTELRHLSWKRVAEITQVLNEKDSWRYIMGSIPKKYDAISCSFDGVADWKRLTEEEGCKYTNDEIFQITKPREGDGRTPAEIFLDEWSTSGRKGNRPTVGVLLQLLVKEGLFRAAELIAEKWLNEVLPTRPNEGPAAPVPVILPRAVSSDSSNGEHEKPENNILQDVPLLSVFFPPIKSNDSDFPNSVATINDKLPEETSIGTKSDEHEKMEINMSQSLPLLPIFYPYLKCKNITSSDLTDIQHSVAEHVQANQPKSELKYDDLNDADDNNVKKSLGLQNVEDVSLAIRVLTTLIVFTSTLDLTMYNTY